MGVTQESLLAMSQPERVREYGPKECMLYAASIGLGADPMDRDQLRFVFEQGLKVMPSMACVLDWDDTLVFTSGLDGTQIVHGEQRLVLHRPLEPMGFIIARERVKDAFDKGEGRGALLVVEKQILDEETREPICTLESVVFARGDGGYGGPAGGPEPLPATPEDAPAAAFESVTRPEAAIFYRLNGDPNPLHIDPDFAAAAGFDRPILHGLCTWGHACHAVVRLCCDYRPERITSFSARFSAPVFPGERLRTEVWPVAGGVHFRTTALERDLPVLTHGFASLA